MAGTVRAVVVDKGSAGGLALRDVPAPAPASAEAVVRVAATSLNRGEVKRAQAAADGWRPGWDLAGTVERAAADGSGPKAGTRVVGFMLEGAWAEAVAVPTNSLAALPDAVTITQAATLPVAGLTALYALARGGMLASHRVLVGGATGGVGTFAVQLARLSGAHVTASIRDGKNEKLMRDLGANEVAVGPDVAAAKGRFEVILESVGGASLGAALRMLAPGGTCVVFGISGAPETTFSVRDFFYVGGASLYGFVLFYELKREPAGIGLARLVRLLANKSLRAPVEVEKPVAEIGKVAADLIERRFTGKAVMHFA